MKRLAFACLVLALASCSKAKPTAAAGGGAVTGGGAASAEPARNPWANPPPFGVLAGLPKVQPRAKFKLPGGRTRDVFPRLSADGKTLAVGYDDKVHLKSGTQVWDIAGAPRLVAEFPGGAFALSDAGTLLAVSEPQAVYDIATQRVVAKLPASFAFGGFRGDMTFIGTRPGAPADPARPGKITVWDIAKNADGGSFATPDDRFTDALFVNGGAEVWLIRTNNKLEFEVCAVAAKQVTRTLIPVDAAGKPFTGGGLHHTATPDGAAVTASVNGSRFIFDGKTGKPLITLPNDLWGSRTGLFAGNRYLSAPDWTAANDAHLRNTDFVIYDWKAAVRQSVLVGHPAGTQPIAAACGDGKTIASVEINGEVLVFDLK